VDNLEKVELIPISSADQRDAGWIRRARELMAANKGDGPSDFLTTFRKASKVALIMSVLTYFMSSGGCFVSFLGMNWQAFVISFWVFVGSLVAVGIGNKVHEAITDHHKGRRNEQLIVASLDRPIMLFAEKLVTLIERHNLHAEIWNQSVGDEEHNLGEIPDEVRQFCERLSSLRVKIFSWKSLVRHLRSRKKFILPASDDNTLAVQFEEMLQMETDLVVLQRLQQTTSIHQLNELVAIERAQTELDAFTGGPERRAADREAHEVAWVRPATERA